MVVKGETINKEKLVREIREKRNRPDILIPNSSSIPNMLKKIEEAMAEKGLRFKVITSDALLAQGIPLRVRGKEVRLFVGEAGTFYATERVFADGRKTLYELLAGRISKGGAINITRITDSLNAQLKKGGYRKISRMTVQRHLTKIIQSAQNSGIELDVRLV
jgi:hypothetical protein